jgi:hypothetical protein
MYRDISSSTGTFAPACCEESACPIFPASQTRRKDGLPWLMVSFKHSKGSATWMDFLVNLGWYSEYPPHTPEKPKVQLIVPMQIAILKAQGPFEPPQPGDEWADILVRLQPKHAAFKKHGLEGYAIRKADYDAQEASVERSCVDCLRLDPKSRTKSKLGLDSREFSFPEREVPLVPIINEEGDVVDSAAWCIYAERNCWVSWRYLWELSDDRRMIDTVVPAAVSLFVHKLNWCEKAPSSLYQVCELLRVTSCWYMYYIQPVIYLCYYAGYTTPPSRA